MTQTIPLQWKIATRTLLAGLQGVSNVYLDRYLPVGSNELSTGPVIILRERRTVPGTASNQRTPATSDGIWIVTHQIEMEITIHFAYEILEQLSMVSDPFVNGVHGVMTNGVAALSNVGGIQWVGKEPGAEGDAAVVRMFYDCYITTSARDFTQPT